ncbi:unnamed protein product [Amoebophrya sp. A120]|nr:unnamed protein product [Amoebophrya sp. A120]|eukprot:GSA120T00011544001.1
MGARSNWRKSKSRRQGPRPFESESSNHAATRLGGLPLRLLFVGSCFTQFPFWKYASATNGPRTVSESADPLQKAHTPSSESFAAQDEAPQVEVGRSSSPSRFVRRESKIREMMNKKQNYTRPSASHAAAAPDAQARGQKMQDRPLENKDIDSLHRVGEKFADRSDEIAGKQFNLSRRTSFLDTSGEVFLGVDEKEHDAGTRERSWMAGTQESGTASELSVTASCDLSATFDVVGSNKLSQQAGIETSTCPSCAAGTSSSLSLEEQRQLQHTNKSSLSLPAAKPDACDAQTRWWKVPIWSAWQNSGSCVSNCNCGYQLQYRT